jgi:hypothetical protein
MALWLLCDHFGIVIGPASSDNHGEGCEKEFFKGRGVALRRPDSAARRPYQGNEEFCPTPHGEFLAKIFLTAKTTKLIQFWLRFRSAGRFAFLVMRQ